MARPVVDVASAAQVLAPRGREGEPCQQRERRKSSGDIGVGQIVEFGLPVREIAPGDEDGDGSEDHISALQGHNRAGAARSGILGGIA